MKTIFAFFLFFFPFLATAQNYSNIVSPGMTFFCDETSFLRGYKYDSVVPAGSDSVFYAPGTILMAPNPEDCSDEHNGPVLGMIVIKKSNGWFDIKDYNSQSSLVNPAATLNQTWSVRTMPVNRHIEAKVTDIRLDSVIDTIDLVKEITFNLKDQNGLLVNHPINGTKILLSEHYGFCTTIDWNFFPNLTKVWTLVGKAFPERGIQDFTIEETFDFQPGDVFHETTRGPITINTIRKILSRTDYTDSIVYIVEKCENIYKHQPPPNIERTWDTITETIELNNSFYLDNFNKIPDLFAPVYPERATRYYRKINGPDGRCLQGFSIDNYHFIGTCWKALFGPSEEYGNIYQYEYGKGIGLFNYVTMGLYYTLETKLVYFSKGDEIWGEPITDNCYNLITSIKNKEEERDVSVYPNPVDQSATIVISVSNYNEKRSLKRFDCYGHMVFASSFEGDSFFFSRDGIPGGMYVLEVYVNDLSIFRKKIILL